MLIAKAITVKTKRLRKDIHTYFHAQINPLQLRLLLLQYFQYILQLSFSLQLQFSQSKYSPTSDDLSHSNSQLLGLQIDLVTYTFISYFLHSQLYLSSSQRFLLLQTLASHLHLHLHISCHFMCLVLLNTLTFMFSMTSETHIFAYGSLILLQLPLHLIVLILKE